MIFLPHILLIGFNVVNAFIDAYKIKVLNKTIRHFINFGAYAIIAGLIVWQFHMNQSRSIVFLISAFFNRQITFDIPLNWRRGLHWDYVTPDEKPGAIMDRIEIFFFKRDGKKLVLAYAILWVASIIILCSVQK